MQVPSFIRRDGIATVLSIGISLTAWIVQSAGSPAEALFHSSRPLVIAHRGFSAIAPENTLPSFQRAVQAGADLVELDYYHSRDGVPVVIHDATLDRTTDATNRWGGSKLKVADRPLAELRQLQAGGWFHPPYPATSLPTLSEAIEVIQQGSVTLIERKSGEAAVCANLLRDAGLVNHVVVQAFDWGYLRDYHQLEPTQILGALGPPGTHNGRKLTDAEKALNPAWLDEIKALGARLAVWNTQVDASAVEAAHARGLKVWVYTVNDLPRAQKLLATGVDGIITDNPAILWKALALR